MVRHALHYDRRRRPRRPPSSPIRATTPKPARSRPHRRGFSGRSERRTCERCVHDALISATRAAHSDELNVDHLPTLESLRSRSSTGVKGSARAAASAKGVSSVSAFTVRSLTPPVVITTALNHGRGGADDPDLARAARAHWGWRARRRRSSAIASISWCRRAA